VPSLANIVGYWLVGLPLGAWLAMRAAWGLAGVWTGFLVALVTVATILAFRLRVVAGRARASPVVHCAAGAT
jgi:MATE family multidrug resistance protein